MALLSTYKNFIILVGSFFTCFMMRWLFLVLTRTLTILVGTFKIRWLFLVLTRTSIILVGTFTIRWLF